MTQQTSDEGWWRLVTLLSRTQDSEEMNHLLQLFLTLDECEDLAKRVLIIQHLLAGDMTQRKLAAEINVSLAKITRGSNSLKLMDRQRLHTLKAALCSSD